MATRLDSGRCLRCGTVLIELEPEFQLCSACGNWAKRRTTKLVKNRKKKGPVRRKLKVGILK